jgi:hypothetical protein
MKAPLERFRLNNQTHSFPQQEKLVFGVSTVRLLHAEVEAKVSRERSLSQRSPWSTRPILKSVVVVKMGPIVAIDYSRPVPVDQQ